MDENESLTQLVAVSFNYFFNNHDPDTIMDLLHISKTRFKKCEQALSKHDDDAAMKELPQEAAFTMINDYLQTQKGHSNE